MNLKKAELTTCPITLYALYITLHNHRCASIILFSCAFYVSQYRSIPNRPKETIDSYWRYISESSCLKVVPACPLPLVLLHQ